MNDVMNRIVKILGLLGLVVIVGFGCSRVATKNTETNETPAIDRSAILLDARKQGLIMDTGEIEHMKDSSVMVVDEKKESAPDFATFNTVDLKTWNAAALADVTSGTSYGIAHFNYGNGQFRIVATCGGLVEPTDGSYFEAWLIKRGDGMKVMDLGKLNPTDKLMTFTYASKADLSEYDFFIVTLQSPNQTVPGEHLLEGMIR